MMKTIFWSAKRGFPAGTLLILAASAVHSQTVATTTPATTGVIQGVIKDNGGQAVPSVSVIAADSTLGGKRFTATTGATGAFSIPGVAPGTYSICVQEPGGLHLDPCQWSTPVQIKVAAGQTVASPSISAVKGTVLQVRVNDPGGLWKVGGGNPAVLLGVMLPSSIMLPMRLASSDAGGKTFDVAIPAGTPVKVSVYAPHFTISDTQGLSLASAVASVQSQSTQTSLPLTYTITGRK